MPTQGQKEQKMNAADKDDWLEPAVIEEHESSVETEGSATAQEDTAMPAVTDAKQQEDPTSALAAKVKGLEAAAAAERHKRQTLERQLAEKAQEEKPYLGEEYEQRFTETRNEFQQQLVAQKLDMSEAFARDKYADFGDKIQVFGQMVQQNPALYQQMVQQSNPADFAYKTAMNQQKLQEMGDPASFEQKLREKITAELEAKYTGKAAAETQKRAELPGSLATVAGARGATAQSWSGPTSLDDLLK